ncbi:MAG TPA: co-chaperone GroES [Thermodesulfobacteriota bacterium]
MNVRPLHDKILIKRIDAPQMTKGGLVIPDTAKEKPQEGKVIAIGKVKILENGKVVPLSVKSDDRILFSKYGGTEIKLDGEDYIILDENEVLAVIED